MMSHHLPIDSDTLGAQKNYNEDRPYNLYFWHDNVAKRVDRLIMQAEQFPPIVRNSHTKQHLPTISGTAFTSGLYDSLKRFRQLAGSEVLPGQLIYVSDRSVNRQESPNYSWRRFKQQPPTADH